jgi:hypothetical protein
MSVCYFYLLMTQPVLQSLSDLSSSSEHNYVTCCLKTQDLEHVIYASIIRKGSRIFNKPLLMRFICLLCNPLKLTVISDMQSRHHFKTLENDVFMNVTSQVTKRWVSRKLTDVISCYTRVSAQSVAKFINLPNQHLHCTVTEHELMYSAELVKSLCATDGKGKCSINDLLQDAESRKFKKLKLSQF